MASLLAPSVFATHPSDKQSLAKLVSKRLHNGPFSKTIRQFIQGTFKVKMPLYVGGVRMM